MNQPSSPARDDPCWYTPADLPAELRAFGEASGRPGLGRAGKVGLLDLRLAPVAGATRVVRQFQRMPLYHFRPLYVDPGWPGMAFVYVLQAGEGIVQGDRYRLDFDCAPGAAVHVTTQAATKIYRMADDFACQMVNVTAGEDAFVEYLPDPVIPFRESRFYQRLHLTLAPGASAILGEVLLPGRVARGEAHAYSLYYTDLEARTPDGTLLFADRLKLAPDSAPPRSPGRLGPYDVLGALHVVTRRLPAGALADRLHSRLDAQADVLAGVSALPGDAGVAVRVLGHSSIAVGAAMHSAWDEARLALVGVPAPDLRKG